MPSRRMSHSVPRRTRKGASSLVRGGDLLGLAAHAVGVQPGHGADADRVVADRQVLVAAVAGGLAHLEDRRLPVRPGRVAVQVAEDVGHLDGLGRLRRAGLAQLGRHEREAERGEDALFVGRVGKRLDRRDPLGRAGRADELGAEAARLGDDQLDRHALDGHAQRPALAALDDGHDLRQRLEPLQHRSSAGTTTASRSEASASAAGRRPRSRRAPRRSTRPAGGCGGAAAAAVQQAAARRQRGE